MDIDLPRLEKLYKRDFVIQKRIEQGQLLGQFHPSSVNTVRVMSLRLGGRTRVVSSVVRFGSGGSNVDNLAVAGGVACGVTECGTLRPFAVDGAGRVHTEHPSSAIAFETVSIPMIDELYDQARTIHDQVLPCDLASFDFALDHRGHWVFIEINLGNQEINFHQFNNGPLFGELTDHVISWALGHEL